MKLDLSKKTLEELRVRREELQFLATQYGMNGAEPPEELSAEWKALEAELMKRRPRGNAPHTL